MKASSRPISSPGRAEKFPPPLIRFLRSNVGSRSRGRSRSSPLFYLRSKKAAAEITETTQEPSSPKVTCIGQVRVRRPSKSTAKTTTSTAVNRRRWLGDMETPSREKRSSTFSSQNRAFWRFFCKWGLLFRSGYCKKVDRREDSFRVSPNQKSEKIGNLIGICKINPHKNVIDIENYSNKNESLEAEAQRNERDFPDSSSSSTPKKALLLARCRSAPYRSSSLGGRFCGSPLNGRDNETENEAKPDEWQNPNCGETENDAKSDELQNPSCDNEEEETRTSEVKSKVWQDSAENVQELKEIRISGGALHPLLLTRCKSEPARTGERLNPQANLMQAEEVRRWRASFIS